MHPQEKVGKGHAWRAYSPLYFVHSDIMGSFLDTSLSEAIYVLTFIYYCTIYALVYFLKLKSKVFEHFHIFKAHVEKQLGNMT